MLIDWVIEILLFDVITVKYTDYCIHYINQIRSKQNNDTTVYDFYGFENINNVISIDQY